MFNIKLEENCKMSFKVLSAKIQWSKTESGRGWWWSGRANVPPAGADRVKVKLLTKNDILQSLISIKLSN